MNDQIWFIYLADHHEGPFTPAEVAAKVAAGAVTAQSLGWKDGMAEWVPIESIPELSAALTASAPESLAAPAPAAPAAAGEEGFSLAQLLVQQQSGGPAAAPAEDLNISDNASVLSSLATAAQSSQGSETPAGSAGSPSPEEEVWTLRIGSQVSGLHSLNRLKALAGDGEIPPDAMLWRPGWSDFQIVSAVPEVGSARRQRKMTSNQSGANSQANLNSGKTGLLQRGGLAPITAGANVGNDEPTDPKLEIGGSLGGFKGLLARVKGLMRRKESARQAKVTSTKFTAKAVSGGVKDKVKKLALVFGVLAVLAAGGAGYIFFFSSPIPSDLDVIADDLEAMNIVAAAPKDAGSKLHLALARGTEDNPADDTAPKFYVATNLPEGTPITLALTGKSGTLVNRITFEKAYTAPVGKNKMAVFERVQDDGKPLPMGEYTLKLSADGSEPVTLERFLGGKKGGLYNDRLKKYKDRLQAEYDKEMQELREYIDTLKSVQADVSRRMAEYKSGWAAPAGRARILADWKSYSLTALGMITQLDTKLKGRNAPQIFQPRAFEDVVTTLSQLQQLIQIHSQRLEGATPAANPEEIEGLATAGVLSLEMFLTQALVKSPFEVLGAESLPAGGPVTPAKP
jgi:hypothetical protein